MSVCARSDTVLQCNVDLRTAFSGNSCTGVASAQVKGDMFFSLYSGSPETTARPVRESFFHMAMSKNRQLSQHGPEAPAQLAAGCSPEDGAFLTIAYPGYPMFGDNTHIKVNVSAENRLLMEFEAAAGSDFFEFMVEDRGTIREIARHLTDGTNPAISFAAHDRDGLQVRADFGTPQHISEFALFVESCL